MKLIRCKINKILKPGIIMGNKFYDVSSFGEDYNEPFFETNGLERLQLFVKRNCLNLKELPKDIVLLSPVTRPSKIVCVGLNYSDHAREIGATLPSEPVIFMKSTSAIIGPYDPIIIPRDSKKTDWEVEMAVIIKKRASYVEESEAMEYVAGYCLHNDVSEREFQLERNGTWDKGKGCDSFAPLGPFLATKDEIKDIDNLRLWLRVNSCQMQDGNTADFIFKIPYLISYISRFMTLLPGDIISTGTPAGVGLGMNPPLYLKAGDVIELGIDGLGTSKQNVINYSKN